MPGARWPAGWRVAGLVILAVLLGGRTARASELRNLVFRIGRSCVLAHDSRATLDSIRIVGIDINHQGDIVHFRAVMVWETGRLLRAPRTAEVFGSLVNRADVRRLYDLEYLTPDGLPPLCVDQTSDLITSWNTRFARDDTLRPDRELGQPLDGPPPCLWGPEYSPDDSEPGERSQRPSPSDEVLDPPGTRAWE